MLFTRRIFHTTCICLSILVSTGRAQGPAGVINGAVTDPSGAVVADVEVHVSNTATGITRETKTNASGLYSFPELLPGTYTVAAEHTGFKRQIQSNITLQVQQTVRVDIALSVGEVSQAVEVTSSAPLLSTEDATVGQVVENKRITELPLKRAQLPATNGAIARCEQYVCAVQCDLLPRRAASIAEYNCEWPAE